MTVPAGTTHTFATVDQDGADVLVVMAPEIDELVTALHTVTGDQERSALWARYRAHVGELP